MQKIHIGKLIQKEVKKSKRKVTEITEELGMARGMMYSIYKRKSMQTALLERIGDVLNHNFFKYYSEALSRELKKRR